MSKLEQSRLTTMKDLHLKNENQKLFLTLQGGSVYNKITLDQAKQINDMIADENDTNGEHMLVRSDEKVMNRANEYGCRVLIVDDQVIGFVYNTPIEFLSKKGEKNHIYEIGGLVRKKGYEGMGIGRKLFYDLLDGSNDLPIVAISNQDHVIKLLKKKEMFEIDVYSSSFPKNIPINSETILENDYVYGNNNLMNLLVSEHN